MQLRLFGNIAACLHKLKNYSVTIIKILPIRRKAGPMLQGDMHASLVPFLKMNPDEYVTFL